ncbi:MAG: 6-phosphofructokinase [Egibacteraceae bacterium]
MRRIAVLTSGGDAPGMNAAIRAVVRSADAAGLEPLGVHQGFEGLIAGRLEPMDARSVSGILHLGGTMLGSARSPRFRTTDGRAEALKHLDLAEVEGLVVIGGDGSFRGADALSREGSVRVVGIPGTIDNDLSGSDFTLGFDTAVNTALELVDRIRDTAASHGRLFFVEVMGRRAGWISLYTALATGGTEALVPERPTDVARLRQRVQRSFELGKRFCLVIVAEGDDAGGAYEVAERVCEGTDIDYRVTTLGHVQRGGSPTMRDRVLAAILGDAAVGALAEGADRVMVGQRRGEVVRTPLEQTWTHIDRPPQQLLNLMDRLAR